MTRPFDARDIEVLHPLESVRRRPAMYLGELEGGAGWLAALNLALSWIHREARRRCGERQAMVLRAENGPCGPFRFSWGPARSDAAAWSDQGWVESLGRLTNSGDALGLEGLGVLNALCEELTVSARGAGFGFDIHCATEASIRVAAASAPAPDEVVTISFRPGPILRPHPPSAQTLFGYLLCFTHERGRLTFEGEPSV